jgi:hypothetical protein
MGLVADTFISTDNDGKLWEGRRNENVRKVAYWVTTGLMGLGRSTHRYRAREAECDAAQRTRLKELAAQRMRFGYRRLTAMLAREATPANHKRVYGCTAKKDWR